VQRAARGGSAAEASTGSGVGRRAAGAGDLKSGVGRGRRDSGVGRGAQGSRRRRPGQRRGARGVGQQVAAGTGLLIVARLLQVVAGASSRWRRPAADPGSIWGTGRGRVPRWGILEGSCGARM
jgi:hypothetical protein